MMMDTTAIGGCSPDSAICARGIIRDFPAGQQTMRVLHGIDSDILPGEMTYIVGESGSGKTTLISIMCGILWPTDGDVRVFGTTDHEEGFIELDAPRRAFTLLLLQLQKAKVEAQVTFLLLFFFLLTRCCDLVLFSFFSPVAVICCCFLSSHLLL